MWGGQEQPLRGGTTEVEKETWGRPFQKEEQMGYCKAEGNLKCLGSGQEAGVVGVVSMRGGVGGSVRGAGEGLREKA